VYLSVSVGVRLRPYDECFEWSRAVGVEIRVENLTKRFGRQTIWENVTLTLPAGEISVLLGPSGTGKSVFLKTLIGLLKPETGSIVVNGTDITKVRERELYEVRKLFGVLFQDGALFGSQNLFDNIAFPLREHTKKSEREIRDIVMEKMELTGLAGAERKLPGEISGGMRKRAGLARALVLDPEVLLFDEPDSGLDPVRTAYLNQLIVDLNAQIEATFLIVTHDISTARTVPDNIGLLYRRHLAMFGPREMLLSSNEPVVRQFLNGQRQGPIGMAEEKDAGELAAEAESGEEQAALPPIPVQLATTNGIDRATMRPPGSWLREHGVVPPPGSFAGLEVEVPSGSGATGWAGEIPKPKPGARPLAPGAEVVAEAEHRQAVASSSDEPPAAAPEAPKAESAAGSAAGPTAGSATGSAAGSAAGPAKATARRPRAAAKKAPAKATRAPRKPSGDS
jgi:phospholipid/cholesterol/gamma-HCH transport system ATP-binding protein